MSLALDEIDRFLASLDGARNDAELRRLFETYNAHYDLDVPSDPFSAEYREHQLALYAKLFGKPYASSHERSVFDVEAAARRPFPYVHGAAGSVGDQLMAIGFLIKTMDLPAGARVLEFGPGWGNTTLALAKMGCEVTAIDIEPNFVELIRRRAEMEDIRTVSVRLGDFTAIEALQGRFDAILFYECFHHCADHLRLIRGFDAVLAPQGLVCFAAEPIVDDFPIPWGLRMDGQSLWAIRRNGWLELGFNLAYFRAAMARHGWSVQSHRGHDTPLASALIARRASEARSTWRYGDGGLRALVGQPAGHGMRADGRAGYLMFGPYARCGPGRQVATLWLDPREAPAGTLRLEVASGAGTKVHASTVAALAHADSQLRLPFELEEAVSDLEIRVFVEADTAVTLTGASLLALTGPGVAP